MSIWTGVVWIGFVEWRLLGCFLKYVLILEVFFGGWGVEGKGEVGGAFQPKETLVKIIYFPDTELDSFTYSISVNH